MRGVGFARAVAAMAALGGFGTVLHFFAQRARGRDYMTVRSRGVALNIPAVPRTFAYHMEAIGKIQALVDAIEVDDAKVVLDVGANWGHFAALAGARWPAARVFAFEPSAVMAQQLQTALGDRVTILREALCDHDQSTLDFFINPKSQATNSLLQDSVDRFATGVIQRQSVTTTTLDGFCERHGITHIDVLKVDIQGSESALLRGAVRMIRSTGCAAIEVSFLDPHPAEVMQVLDANFARRRVINFVSGGADIVWDGAVG